MEAAKVDEKILNEAKELGTASTELAHDLEWSKSMAKLEEPKKLRTMWERIQAKQRELARRLDLKYKASGAAYERKYWIVYNRDGKPWVDADGAWKWLDYN